MRILIEGEQYSIELLQKLLGNQHFYITKAGKGIVNYVGYFHSETHQEVVYLLPKVFFWNKKVFGKYDLSDVATRSIQTSLKHDAQYAWVRHLLILFYKSLSEFKRRQEDTTIVEQSNAVELNSNLGEQEYSYLDLVLSFLNFHKKNKNFIQYKHIEQTSHVAKRPNWSKTIRKTIPLLNARQQPIYTQIKNRKPTKNSEEELFTIFYSILYHFKLTHDLSINIDTSYPIYKGQKFNWLQSNGLNRLKRIKYKYFSDKLRRMYQLCSLYLEKTDRSSLKLKNEDFIVVRNYNIVFEDMVDKLFTDERGTTIQRQKNNRDGKIIDHLYEYQSLIDDSHIFYIGDSKYYKSDHQAGNPSIYKQFTYAKNVIQYNLDLFHNNKSFDNVRYRDELTEGYNVSPNFFIYGYIPTDENEQMQTDFEQGYLNGADYEIHQSYHFKGRLFDRDTLFVHQYQLNFLFVLNAYTMRRQSMIETFRKETKRIFRENFINFFNNKEKCGFEFRQKEFEPTELKQFVNEHFRLLNGRVISIENKILLVACPFDASDTFKKLINDFEKTNLT